MTSDYEEIFSGVHVKHGKTKNWAEKRELIKQRQSSGKVKGALMLILKPVRTDFSPCEDLHAAVEME